MFKCLGWPCLATFILLLFETPILTLCLLAPRNTWCGNACFGAQVSSKYGTWYSERVISQFMCVGCWAGVTYLRYTVLTNPKKGETAVHCYDPTLSVVVMLVSRNVFQVVSALQSIVYFLYVFFRYTNEPLGTPTRRIKIFYFMWAAQNCLYPRDRQGREIFLCAPSFLIAPSSMVLPRFFHIV